MKARLFDRMAAAVDLRIVTAPMYAESLAKYGPTARIRPPVERERFTLTPRPPRRGGIVAGFSGYTYSNQRKGEDLARLVVQSKPGHKLEWRASGRGWPVKTIRYLWAMMPNFYQSLDILVVTSRVEGVPMPPLEALACGVSVVIPTGVGLLDELPEVVGIHRYQVGNVQDCIRALEEARQCRSEANREELRAAIEPYTIAGWCEGHKLAFEELILGKKPVLNPILTASDDKILAEIRQVYPDVEAVLAWTRRHIPAIKREISPYQGAVLAYYAHQHNRPGSRFLEIGTALGYSACLMATAAPQAAITTLNPKDGEFEKARENLKIRSTVRVIKKTSQDFLKTDADGLYDLIFVDGDHAYGMVLHDAQFFNRLRPGGLILFHDYSPEGSTRPCAGSFQALNDLQDRHRPADVQVIGSGQVGMLGWIRREGEVWS
jgi:predicted O-methyltransferase YrrM